MISQGQKYTVITTLYRAGLTPSQIAENAAISLSRIEVLSALYRHGLTARAPTIEAPVKIRKGPPPRPEPRPVTLPKLIPGTYRPRADTIPPAAGLVTLDMLKPGACRWPIGDPKAPGFTFCGCHAEQIGSSYCNKHRRRAYKDTTP